MNQHAFRVEQKVHSAWNGVLDGLKQMNQASTVRPEVPSMVFKVDQCAPDDVVKLLVGPVVFNIPERANGQAANLFIVIKGWLTFEGPDFGNTPFKTGNFGTNVAYFRLKDSRLEHVFGAHYDMDEMRNGHPVFHAQFSSQINIGSSIKELFNRSDELVDHLEKILNRVRTPTAQMDVFSVFTQICADHLMWEQSAPEVQRAFEQTRSSCNFIVGAAHRLAYLNSKPAIGCYRSTHWYGPNVKV